MWNWNGTGGLRFYSPLNGNQGKAFIEMSPSLVGMTGFTCGSRKIMAGRQAGGKGNSTHCDVCSRMR